MTITTARRICPLCEACCGLLVESADGRLTKVRPNADDVFSKGYSCVKGLNLAAIDNDPDRLRRPMIREHGELRDASWDEAFALIAKRLPEIIEVDRNACAVYLGNPYAHNLDLQLYGSALLSALRTRSLYSAATIDSMPRNAANGLMYGTGFGIPVPDIARTQFLLVLGSNLLISNGSTMSAPGLPDKLRELRRRGGRFVVVDPVQTRTTRLADQHVAIRPGADAYLLMAMISVLADDGSIRLRAAEGLVEGLNEVLELAAPFTPEAVADRCGIPAVAIRDLARELTAADSAAVHARIGANTQEFGTVTSWLVDVLNVITGNLDRPGGVMFALPPAGGANTRAAKNGGWPHSRWATRVRGARELQGEVPLACLAEEIETPGAGQVRALVTIAGNLARSAPNSARLEKAFGQLEFMVCVDNYLNETTRHADVILPGPRMTTRGHFDIVINQTASHNAARYSPVLDSVGEGELSEREIMLRLAAIVRGNYSDFDLDAADAAMALDQARRLPLPDGVTPELAVQATGSHRGNERLLDLMLRSGPYGDGFGEPTNGLTLQKLIEHPDGVDLGPPRSRLPEVLRTASGRIELAPELLVADVERLRARLDSPPPETVLVGRRQMRGMNSWLHNSVPATSSSGCTLFVHPQDAERLGLADGGVAMVSSAVGSLEAEVEITDAVPPGVVSLPHGWGHSGNDTRLARAGRSPGVNVNLLTDDETCEAVTGTPYYSGIPVTLKRPRDRSRS
jgi:anaerobic selenocysteine-containing dehydrogenase